MALAPKRPPSGHNHWLHARRGHQSTSRSRLYGRKLPANSQKSFNFKYKLNNQTKSASGRRRSPLGEGGRSRPDPGSPYAALGKRGWSRPRRGPRLPGRRHFVWLAGRTGAQGEGSRRCLTGPRGRAAVSSPAAPCPPGWGRGTMYIKQVRPAPPSRASRARQDRSFEAGMSRHDLRPPLSRRRGTWGLDRDWRGGGGGAERGPAPGRGGR